MTPYEKVFERSKKTIADLRRDVKAATNAANSLQREVDRLSARIADLQPKALDKGAQRALQALEDALDGEEENIPSVTKAKVKRCAKKQ